MLFQSGVFMVTVELEASVKVSLVSSTHYAQMKLGMDLPGLVNGLNAAGQINQC